MSADPLASPLAMPPGYERAVGPHINIIPWAIPRERLERAASYWLATCGAGGVPHVRPVWGIWYGRSLYFTGVPTAKWARNLAANARASIHLESADDVLVLDGTVSDVPRIADAALARFITSTWETKYRRLVPDPATDGMYVFQAATARGWSVFPHDATRWVFADPA